MLNKCCNGNPVSTFQPYYGFHTLTKLFNRPGLAEAVLQTRQKYSLRIQLWDAKPLCPIRKQFLLPCSGPHLMWVIFLFCPVIKLITQTEGREQLLQQKNYFTPFCRLMICVNVGEIPKEKRSQYPGMLRFPLPMSLETYVEFVCPI